MLILLANRGKYCIPGFTLREKYIGIRKNGGFPAVLLLQSAGNDEIAL
jgi:hypothetical protein